METMREKRERGDIMSNKLRIQILYEQQGACFDCGIEEWRTKERLQAHRLVKGIDGGKYLRDNVILVCRKCHYARDRK